MEKYAINKKMIRQLALMNNHKEPSLQVLDSLYAQMVLEVAIYRFKKSKLLQAIDQALELKDKSNFNALVEKYNELLVTYKDGIHLSEQGFEYTLKLDE